MIYPPALEVSITDQPDDFTACDEDLSSEYSDDDDDIVCDYDECCCDRCNGLDGPPEEDESEQGDHEPATFNQAASDRLLARHNLVCELIF